MSSNANEKKRATRVFDQWKSELVSMDRGHASLLDNFDLLFENMLYSNITFDVAESFLNEAIAAHMPNKYIVKLTFKKRKDKGISEQDFFEEWKRLITDRGKQAFFLRYPLEIDKPEPAPAGAMSRDEYVRQRRYADSFPSIDLGKMKEQVIDEEEEISLADLGV